MVTELAEIVLDDTTCGNVHRHRIVMVGRQKLDAHQHNFAHAHLVVRGPIRCTLFAADGGVLSVTDYPQWSFFEIPADVGHQLESLNEAGAEGWCLFAVRDEDGGVAYQVTDTHRKDRFWHDRKGFGD